ncbi:hypothetical protein IV454_00085 [Massilia antarctica]|uniref:DUF7931 domain-containing protein n=1 Tax=Massilia antarctica TaxID=2765360 RepID=A0AA48WED0_9BURK|nr:hypothetical protein [Massilia antarctica]QPI50054.1 hypothetical protein IV454_32455 [Massilia antarctica]QPI50085.1 hypothetical protein IV454_00085 [Massilia antarctica]
MTDLTALPFNSHAEFEAQLRDCLGRARSTLQLFDPDFSVFPLGSSETDAALRHFLAGGGAIQIAMHDSAHIERHYPRFLRLLREFNHKIEARATPRSLHHLTDSFCIADGMHIVRRFHSDHMRGEASFDLPKATELSQERFAGIWIEAVSTLHPTTTGL